MNEQTLFEDSSDEALDQETAS